MSGVYNQGPSQEQRDTTLRDLIAVIFKRKWYIITIFTVVTAVVVGRTMTQPETYSADARVLLKRAGARASVLDRNTRVLPWVEVVESEIEVIKSLPVMEGAVAKLREPSETHPEGLEIGVFGLAANVSVGVMNESNVLYVQGTWTDPQTAVAITNAVAEAYVDYHKELFALPEVELNFVNRADSVLAQLQTAQNEQQTILDAFGVTSVEEEETQLIRQREILRRELIEVERDVARLSAELESAERVAESGTNDMPFDFEMGMVQGATVWQTMGKLRDQRAELERLREKYTESHPLRAEAEGNHRRLVQEVHDSLDQLIAVRRHDLNVTEREASMLRASIVEIETRLAQIPGVLNRLSSVNTRIKSLNDQYEKFAEYIADSQASAQSFQEYSATILSRALRAQQNAKGDIVRLALAPLLALMMGVFLAFYLENLDHSLGNREDVERHLDIPVLASFPEADMDDPTANGPPEESRSRIPFKRSRVGKV